ncbi:hypothetical protein Hamer_G023642 [Homarus americanus]|uniref:Uncharacterized protein n=1 Tax=Homarus americanus TaxID=6706 RepID=A0A8J5JEL9_HOMAM|nr:hypothetical protein Hamer_G023642 [Homarus americanus]
MCAGAGSSGWWDAWWQCWGGGGCTSITSTASSAATAPSRHTLNFLTGSAEPGCPVHQHSKNISTPSSAAVTTRPVALFNTIRNLGCKATGHCGGEKVVPLLEHLRYYRLWSVTLNPRARTAHLGPSTGPRRRHQEPR